MHIFSSPHQIDTKDGTVFQPGVRYVVPTGMARTLESGLIERLGAEVDYRLSHFNSYENRYHGQPLGNGRLAIYRHGAIGDTLMATAVVAEIRRRNPEAQIDLYCRPSNVDLWHGLGVNVRPGFPVFDEVRGDQHLFYENMLESDSEPDQRCAIDNMLAFAGIDPASVPSDRKIPVVVERAEDFHGGSTIGKYVVVQDGASNGNRSYPHTEALCEQLWGIGVQVLRMGENRRLPSFRNVIPHVKNAALVICPDSSIGHLAAAFPHVPVISLWGLFHPGDRIRYYRNHHPIVGFRACPHAPCRSHLFVLPHQCKDAPSFDGKSCAALAAISPEVVIAKAKELLCLS